MTLREFVGELSLRGGTALVGSIIAVLLTLIQITPVKVNPLSFIARRLGNAFNGDIKEKLEKLENEVALMHKKADEREANLCRSRILRFSDEILHSEKHSKEHFDQILIDISFYENYCSNHPEYKNNIAEMAIKNIKHVYAWCMNEKCFLT